MGRPVANILRLLLVKEGKPSWLYKRIFKLSQEDMQIVEFLGYVPYNTRLYHQAFRHRSMSTKGRQSENNERLEFLGDAVIDSIISDVLFQKHPQAQEGELTEARALIVHRSSLNKIAQSLGIDHLLYATQSAKASAPNLYGNALEALTGAIYLDQGYEFTKAFYLKRIIGPLADISTLPTHKNAKSELLEWTQEYHIINAYLLLSTDRNKENQTIFTMQVQLGADLLMGIGQGTSKKEAQQQAAKETLDMISADPSYRQRAIDSSLSLAQPTSTEEETEENKEASLADTSAHEATDLNTEDTSQPE